MCQSYYLFRVLSIFLFSSPDNLSFFPFFFISFFSPFFPLFPSSYVYSESNLFVWSSRKTQNSVIHTIYFEFFQSSFFLLLIIFPFSLSFCISFFFSFLPLFLSSYVSSESNFFVCTSRKTQNSVIHTIYFEFFQSSFFLLLIIFPFSLSFCISFFPLSFHCFSLLMFPQNTIFSCTLPGKPKIR